MAANAACCLAGAKTQCAHSGSVSGVSRTLRRGVTTSSGGSGPLGCGVGAVLDSLISPAELVSACIDIVLCRHRRRHIMHLLSSAIMASEAAWPSAG